MFKSLFGYTLKAAKNEVRDVVQAFSLEIEHTLCKVEDGGGRPCEDARPTRLTLCCQLRALASLLEDALFSEPEDPAGVRFAAAGLATAGLVAALTFGELLPRPERA